MIAQFQELKAQHPDTLLFFRMGDFYELFFDDAVQAAPALEIALTKRGRHAGEDIPMCGVPVHNAELYLHRLIRKRFRVAICEQLEDPAEARKRGGKSLVRRDVVRIVTPGTLTEDGLLEARRNNYLLAVAAGRSGLGLAWADISTGAFATQPCTTALLGAALARIEPGEVLVPEALRDLPALRELAQGDANSLRAQPDTAFDSQRAERRLCAAFGVRSLEGFGAFTRAELAAAGALLDYLELTQKGALPRLAPPRRVEPAGIVQIDAATRRNLELTQGLAGGREGSLLHAIDRTVTGSGARLLAERLAAPLTEVGPIQARLDAVACLVTEPGLRDGTRGLLRRCPDLERALSRLALGRSGPRDLVAVAQALERAGRLRTALAPNVPLHAVAARLEPPADLGERLTASLVDEPPLLAREGGFIRAGVRPELDELRSLRDLGRQHIVALEERYRRESGIATLKIRYNNLIGWFVEVASAHESRVPAGFVRRQSMAGATRYATAELGELESRIDSAAEKALALELELFEALRAAVLAASAPLGEVAGGLAEADVAAALAELASAQRYVRPQVEDGPAFSIEGGRHPVVELARSREGQPFVANDCDLGPDAPLWLLTGPNMAGKSTFLRQNALIALLAQIGSFVPATAARLGVVDRLFSRVGAADDLARGRSTFMVEMVETAAILNLATPRSLVILDEIGRGTATYDGLSIAWAVVEHLHDVNRCRGLFATHYHELTALAARLPRLACHTLKVKEWQGEVVFMHEVVPGTADRSYGIHVARLAGLPEAVLSRAEAVLHRLEEGEARAAPARLADDLPLFAAVQAKPAAAVSPALASPPAPSAVEQAIRATNPDELSPRQALDLLYRLRQQLLEAGIQGAGTGL